MVEVKIRINDRYEKIKCFVIVRNSITSKIKYLKNKLIVKSFKRNS